MRRGVRVIFSNKRRWWWWCWLKRCERIADSIGASRRKSHACMQSIPSAVYPVYIVNDPTCWINFALWLSGNSHLPCISILENDKKNEIIGGGSIMIIKFCRRYSCSCSWQSIARSLSDLAIHQQWVNEWDSPMTDCWRLTEWLHVHLPNIANRWLIGCLLFIGSVRLDLTS